MKTFIITREEIEAHLSMHSVIEAVEEAYKLFALKKVTLAPVLSIEVEKHNGEVDIKSGYETEEDVIGVKLASGHWDNPDKYGLPSGLATIMLMNGKNGVPLAIMDGGLITDMRTGAAGAVSAKYLARKDAKKVAILGTGMQARMQLNALANLFTLDEVFIWGRNSEKVKKYSNEMKKLIPHITFTTCDTASNCVEHADIIVTTTPSKQPLFTKQAVKPGTHIICIGTDMAGKQEIDVELFRNSKVIVDSLDQCRERGEVQHAIQQRIITEAAVHGEIGEVIIGQKQGRTNQDEITIFDSTGLAIQDITTAKYVLNIIQQQPDALRVNLF